MAEAEGRPDARAGAAAALGTAPKSRLPGFRERDDDVSVDAPPVEPDDFDVFMLALMRIEGKVNYLISLLEENGQDDA